MENKEEIIEEINEIEDIPNEKNTKTSESNGEKGILDGIDIDAALNNTTIGNDGAKSSPSNSKTLLIVLLSSLLAIDVVALIIYIIGIDKVLAFIK